MNDEFVDEAVLFVATEKILYPEPFNGLPAPMTCLFCEMLSLPTQSSQFKQ